MNKPKKNPRSSVRTGRLCHKRFFLESCDSSAYKILGVLRRPSSPLEREALRSGSLYGVFKRYGLEEGKDVRRESVLEICESVLSVRALVLPDFGHGGCSWVPEFQEFAKHIVGSVRGLKILDFPSSRQSPNHLLLPSASPGFSC